MKSIIKKLGLFVGFLMTFLTSAAYDFELEGIAYTITSLTDLTVSVDQLIKTDLTDVRVPENVEYKNKSLKVTSISNNAFKGNEVLKTIYLPNTITSIGSSAFMGDSSLTTINIPMSVTYIGAEACSGCSSITTVDIPSGVKQIFDKTFYGCKSLININIPSSVVSIGELAFAKSGLQSITIPESVTSLGGSTFAYTHLKSIQLPYTIDVVPAYCFYDCQDLFEVTFSSSKIDSYAFSKCTSLQQISLPENLTTIGDMAFEGCTNLIEFSIPSEVTNIKPSILWNCPNISKLTIGRGLDGLPVTAEDGKNEYTYKTLGGYLHKDNGGYFGTTRITKESYLQGVKEFIIEDSDTQFRIKGFEIDGIATPPFANMELDYYYVGRPLVDIEKWSSNSILFTSEIKQGSGRILKLEINGNCTFVPYFYQKIDTLKLGANITEFNLKNIYKEDIAKIECLSETPPTCTYASYSNFPTKVYTDAILCVPLGCKEAYANAEVWKNFWNIYEVDSKSGITEISNDNDDVIYHVYNITGLLIGESYSLEEIKQLPKGIYILVNKFKKYKIKI